MTMTALKVTRAKVGLLELARHPGRVTQACRVVGCSRGSLHRFRDLYENRGNLARKTQGPAKAALRKQPTASIGRTPTTPD